MTIFEFKKKFPTEKATINFIIKQKYANKEYACPHCGVVGKKIYHHNIIAKTKCPEF